MKIEEMSDLTDAMAKLDAAEAAEPAITQEGQVQTHGDTTATPPQPTSTDVAPKSDSLTTDTPAAADPKTAEPTKTQTTKQPDKSSAFAKDQQRRDTSWKAINAEKAALVEQQNQLKASQEAHQRQVDQHKLQQAKAQSQFTPDQIEARATERGNDAARALEQAEAWQARADKLEGEGKMKDAARAQMQADQLKEQAAESKAMAKALKARADQVRQAPPDKTLEQHKAKLDQQMRGYTLKAVEQWPEFGKNGSEFQKAVAAGLQEARSFGLEVNENPALIHYAARLVAGETAAARVPAMEKELGELRAKVKDLEGLTAPGGGSAAVQRQQGGNTSKTDAEEEAELRAEAAARG